MKKVVRIAKEFRSIYENEKENLGIPFFKGFPENCCEGSSFFFAFYLMNIIPYSTVEIVKGKHETRCYTNYHIWVEVDGLIFDLTADQFNDVKGPVYGKRSHPLSEIYIPESREFVSSYYFHYTKNALEKEKVAKIYCILVDKLKNNKRIN